MSQASSLSHLTKTLETYFRVTKPRVWWLLVFTGVGGLFLGTDGIPPLEKIILILAILISGSAGAETVANYFEIDIDRIMRRTMRRPLPSGQINPPEKALAFGLILIVISVMLSLTINLYVLAFLIFGIFDYVVIYVLLSKRRTPLNIFLGSFAGGAPAMMGHVAATNQLTLEGFLLASIVVLWIPIHVWSLALKYKDDYARANIPMLPVIISEDKAIRCIASTSILMALFNFLLYLLDPIKFGLLYLVITAPLSIALLYLSLRLFFSPTHTNTWSLFKFTSPYLALIFIAIILNSTL